MSGSPFGNPDLGAPGRRVTVPAPPVAEAPTRPPETDDPYRRPGERTYRMMRLVRGNRHARRLRICLGDGQGRAPKWAFILDVQDNLERQDAKTPQVLTLVTNVGTFQLDGFGFDREFDGHPPLHAALLDEQVIEVVCFRTGHHGELRPGEPHIVRITEIEPEEEEGDRRVA